MKGKKEEKKCKCQICEQEYSLKEHKRIYGDKSWKHEYCSPQCYTKAVLKED